MNKYQNGKIYKLVCDATPIVYYGSTIRPLADRLTAHRGSGNTCNSKELFNMGNVSIELVEEYPCNNRHELESRERIYIDFMLNNFTHRVICNKTIPTRTKEEYTKEYLQLNRVCLNEKSKKYYKENREYISFRASKPFNCECGGKYTYSSKSKHFKTKKHMNYINSSK